MEQVLLEEAREQVEVWGKVVAEEAGMVIVQVQGQAEIVFAQAAE